MLLMLLAADGDNDLTGSEDQWDLFQVSWKTFMTRI